MTKRDYETLESVKKAQQPKQSIVKKNIADHIEESQPYQDMRISKGGRADRFKKNFW